ncbi:MAG: hypothetical protein AB1630_04885 [bacterium]
MMQKIHFAILGFFFLGLFSNGFSQDVTNRQILEKLEKLEIRMERVEGKINNMDVRITRLEEGQKSIQRQIDDLRGLLYVILAGMFGLIGFVLWDRRTALAPAVKRVEALEKKEESLEKALKEFALKKPRLAEAFRYAGIS